MHFPTSMKWLLINQMKAIESILKEKYDFLIFNIKWDDLWYFFKDSQSLIQKLMKANDCINWFHQVFNQAPESKKCL